MLSNGGDQPTSPLIYILDKGTQVYLKRYSTGAVVDFTGEAINGIYVLAPISCGDFTAIGSNIKPGFWVD